MNYCIFCNNKLIEESFRLSPCDAEFCVFKFEEMYGINLCRELKKYFELTKINLSLTSKALFSQRASSILEPFPSFCLKKKEFRDRSVFGGTKKISDINESNKNIGKMRELMVKFPNLEILKDIANTEVVYTIV